MKDEKLKLSESQNSLKGKSTFENSKIYDRIKSSKNSLNSKENVDNKKKTKKIILLQKSKRLEKNKIQEKKDVPNSKDEKNKKIKNKTKISTTIIRNKISNRIIPKTNEQSEKTPCQPMKKTNEFEKQILTMSSLSRIKETDIKISKIKNKKNNNNITLYKEPYLTLQNSSKVPKVYKMKKNKKTLEKTKEENSEELDNISQDILPQIITDTMYKKDSKSNNKRNTNTKKLRNNIISLSKNRIKKKKLFYDNAKLNLTIPMNYKNQTLNTSCTNKNNESINKKSLNVSTDKNNSIYNRTFLRNKKLNNYLKTDVNKESGRKTRNRQIHKSGLTNCNYLKYTVSAINKIVHKNKNKKDSTHNISMSSRPLDKKIKSINRNEKRNKLKQILILRNTISRYKLYSKNLLFDDKPKKEGIKSPKLTKNSPLYNSAKNCLNKINNYKMIKLLGKGSYGEVKLAIDKITLKKYAIKIYPKKALEDPKKKSNIENEIAILKQLDNINIMKLYEVIKTDKFQYLIMEYIEGISLLDIIKKEKNHYLEEKRALKIFKQIIQAIDYCQSKNICHRDIKLENILTVKNDVIKLIDFGFAVMTNKETYQTLLCGSPSYMAPEIVKKEKYIAQYSDIWSLGVLLYSMLYGRFPFKGKTQKELFENIKKGEVVFPDDIKINEKIISLIKKIFVVSPIQRPSLKEILEEISYVDE